MIGGQWLYLKSSDNCRWKLIRERYMPSSTRSFLHLLCMREKMDRAFYHMMHHQNFDPEILMKSSFRVWGIGWLISNLMKVCQWSVWLTNNQFRLLTFFYCIIQAVIYSASHKRYSVCQLRGQKDQILVNNNILLFNATC